MKNAVHGEFVIMQESGFDKACGKATANHN
jgi:hypothetical protein